MIVDNRFQSLSSLMCEKACQYALDRLATDLPPRMYYHSLRHTVEDVLPHALRLAKAMNVNPTERLLIRTAACFHDIGFTVQRTYHERVSVDIARQMLPTFGYTQQNVDAIILMIDGTELPQTPLSPGAQILADADLDLLGRPDYVQRNLDLRLELTASGVHLTDAEWYATQLEFISQHQYFTLPARKLRDAGKQLNIRKLRNILAELPSPIFTSPMPEFSRFGLPAISRHYLP